MSAKRSQILDSESSADESGSEQEMKAPRKTVKVTKARPYNWVFTQFKNPEKFYDYWNTCDLPKTVRYICYQLEICPKTKAVHVQGYVQMNGQYGIRTMKKLFRSRSIHLEPARGKPQECIDYCTKEETRYPGCMPVQRGEPKEQGRRTDLEMIARQVIEGKMSVDQVALQEPTHFLRHNRGLRELERISHPPAPRAKPAIFYVYGPPRCGKTAYVSAKFPDAFHARDSDKGWMDGYAGESTIIFDEFNGQYPLRDMLALLDYQKLQLPIKNSFVPIRATMFCFTSNSHPRFFYTDPKEIDGNEAWMQRLNEFGIIVDASENAAIREYTEKLRATQNDGDHRAQLMEFFNQAPPDPPAPAAPLVKFVDEEPPAAKPEPVARYTSTGTEIIDLCDD